MQRLRSSPYGEGTCQETFHSGSDAACRRLNRALLGGLGERRRGVENDTARWLVLVKKGDLLMMKLPMRKKEQGQGLVEYALIIALVAIVVIAILVLMGPQIGDIFSTITHGL